MPSQGRPELSLSGFFTNLRHESFLHLSVRAHTTIIQDCRLRKLANSGSDGQSPTSQNDGNESGKCPRGISLRGSPPDMTLALPLDILNGEKWLLELTNEVGTGHLDLDLSSSDEDEDKQEKTTNTEKSASESFTEESTADVTVTVNPFGWIDVATDSVSSGTVSKELTHVTYIAAIIAIVIIVGIVSISVTIVLVKRGSRNTGVPEAIGMKEEKEVVLEESDQFDEVDEDSQAGSERSNNTYEEIPDRPVSLALESRRPPRRHCQAPRVDPDPDDYLHPLPTPSDLHAAEASGDAKSSQDPQTADQNCGNSCK